MKLKTLVAALAAAGLAGGALAQSSGERVVITGSSIKRIATEGALPVQIVTRAELDRGGITTAEQFILELSTNGNGLDNLASNADVVGGAQRGNNGATSANLRGQGSNATLILLNGRRVSSHGLNGGQVDLNQIPMAAVERIEILKDGASAIYGTDAVGGVINFILRTNFTGLRAQAVADVTEAGGGNIFRGSIIAGFGDLETDRFNVLATLSYRDAKALRGDQRDFVNTFQPDRGLSVDTRGTPHATIFPLAGTLFPTAASTPFIPNTTVRASGGLNILDLPGGPGCGAIPDMAPYSDALWNNPTAALACAWDSGRAAVLQQPVQNLNFVLRGTVRFGAHQMAAEFTGSTTDSAKRFSHAQVSSNTTNAPLRFPRNADSQAAYDTVFDALLAAFPGQVLESQRGETLAYRWRCIECGPREIKTEVDTRRLFVGFDGPLFGDWEYRGGAFQATSEAKSTLGSGYYYRGTLNNGQPDGRYGIVQAMNSGLVNPFLMPGQTQSAAGLAALEQASARGVVLYGGKYTVENVDFSASGPVFKLPGGDAMAAVGVDFRTEKYKFNGDERAANERQVIFLAPFDDANALSGVKRDVKAVYAELLLPLFKDFETTLAVRRDDYSGFGGTTNPKISAVWKPLSQFLVRGSYSTGFRVPTFNQIFNPAVLSASGVDRVDPATCPSLVVNPADPGCQPIRPETLNGGRTTLGPEEAKMYSAGVLFEPIPQLSIGLDWWSIKREGTIQVLGVEALMRNYALFPERFIRDGTGALVVIDNTLLNAGETETEGVEVSVRGGFDAAGARWTAGLDGTYLLKKRSRVVSSANWGPSEVGRFTFAGDLGLRWKHNAFVTARLGDWSSTLSQTYRHGYNDQVLPGVATGNVSPPNWKAKVDSYTTYNWSMTYTGIKNLTVTGLVKNVLDKDPPFAITYSSDFGSGSSWEPRVADPRGRAYVVTVEYKFF
ncbi:MAG: TonB-dependent receptor [Rubrivivax sp.]|nr:TonB-dependent receptor [Rubrivivax sp.]